MTVSVYNTSGGLLGTASGADWSLNWNLPTPYPSFGSNFGARSITGVNFTKRVNDVADGTLLAYIDGVYAVQFVCRVFSRIRPFLSRRYVVPPPNNA